MKIVSPLSEVKMRFIENFISDFGFGIWLEKMMIFENFRTEKVMMNEVCISIR